jgi:hypothetical protein
MVYLVIDPEGGQEAARAARVSTASIWAGLDAYTSHDQKQLRDSGLSLTVFNYSLRSATPEVLADALATIEEHHPSETIWVQHAPQQTAATLC